MDENDFKNLVQKLKDEDPEVRLEAAEALGEAEDEKTVEKAVESLIPILNDENPQVRLQAAKSLSKIGKPAVKPLINALKGDEGNIRRYATYALKDIGDSSVAENLIEALSDNDWGVRKFAAKSLGDMQEEKAVEPLIAALGDDDWGVRVAVTKALGNIGDERAVGPIKKARRAATGDKEYKKAANKALKKIPVKK
jgi:HEAT repeat protein